MKKAEAISILATSVRPREAKDRARYDEAVKMAIEALKSSERTAEASQTDHIADSDKKVERDDESAQNVKDGDLIFRQAAIDAIDAILPVEPMRNEYTQGITCGAALAIEYVKQLPSAQPEIMRCRDCRYSEYDALYDDRYCHYDGKADIVPDEHYCGYAERRTDE